MSGHWSSLMAFGLDEASGPKAGLNRQELHSYAPVDEDSRFRTRVR